MERFRFSWPTRVIFGRGVLEEVGWEVSKFGERVMIIVGGRSAERFGYLDKVFWSIKIFTEDIVIHRGISPNPTLDEAKEAGERARETGRDVIVALGGGSVMDAAKGAAAWARGFDPWEARVGGRAKVKDALPLVAVPTVAASGSEVGGGAVLTRERVKFVFASSKIRPKAAIWDPSTTHTLPADITADGAVDIVCHVLDRFYNGPGSSPLSDRLAASLVLEVMHAARTAVRDPGHPGARDTLAWASSVAITPFTDLGRGGHFTLHWIEHGVSGFRPNLSHGRGLGILLLPWMRLMAEKYPGRHKLLGRLLGGEPTELLGRWLEDLGITDSLSGWAFTQEELADVNRVVWDNYAWGLGGLSPQDTLRVLEEAL